MKIAVVTANLGGFEANPRDPVVQSTLFDMHRFTDDNFPPRIGAMTPRLQARIPKMFAWQMLPGYDYYIWVDGSCALLHPDSVRWLVQQCEGVHMAVFKHPQRNTIQEEADYLKYRLSINCPYITPRYKNELIDEQMAEIKGDKEFRDNHLFATTAIVYRNDRRVRRVMHQWWYHTSRYHCIDQLSLPYVLMRNAIDFRIIPDDYSNFPYLSYVRGR